MEFSEIYKYYDQEEQKNLEFRRKLEAEITVKYLTFHEKIKEKLNISLLTLSISFGGFLFLAHLTMTFFENGADPDLIVRDFSFFLAILNSVGIYLIFNATEKFRAFIVNLVQLTKEDDEITANAFLKIYSNKFLGRRNIIYGFLFGVINCCLALFFGITYQQEGQYLLLSTFIIQVFTIGFIGGITVNGTKVIINLIDRISIKDDINLTYFYPDKCAGTLVIGNILFLFSIHFIVIGILIFLFIHNYEWVHLKNGEYSYYISGLIIFWKTFPFILSGVVFFTPVKKLNTILKEYKLFEQLKIRKRMNYLARIIMSLESDKEESKEKIEILDNHYQKLAGIDKEIELLSTWPYNLRHRTTFLSVFLPVLIGIILEISKQMISNLF